MSGPRVPTTRSARNGASVAANMRMFRAAAGVSQTELGNAVGVTFQQIQKYEKGVNACPPGRLLAICKILKVSIAQMFGAPPRVDGEEVPLGTQRAHRTLAALGRLKNERVKRAIEDLIAELAE